MDKRTLIAHLGVIGLLGIAALALRFGVDIHLEDKPGVYMRMPDTVGKWHGEKLLYCHNEACRWSGTAKKAAQGEMCPQCGEPAFTMAWVEKEQLPADTEFLKYIYTQPSGQALLVSIVLSGNARNSIHRPQRCLVAQGFNITHSQSETVPIPGRPPLKLMLIDTVYRTTNRTGPQNASAFYAYWFVGQDRETPSHLIRMFWLAWDRVFRGVAHRWVYIMIQGRNYESRQAFERALDSFIPRWYPTVLR